MMLAEQSSEHAVCQGATTSIQRGGMLVGTVRHYQTSLSLHPFIKPTSRPPECTACARANQQEFETTLRRRSSRYSCWSSFRWRMMDVPRPRDGFSESLQQSQLLSGSACIAETMRCCSTETSMVSFVWSKDTVHAVGKHAFQAYGWCRQSLRHNLRRHCSAVMGQSKQCTHLAMVKEPPAWLSQMYCSSSLCFVMTVTRSATR